MTLSPSTPDVAVNPTVRARVEALLLAYRVTQEALRRQLADAIVAEAERDGGNDPAQPLEDRAVAIAYRQIAGWIDTLLGPSNENPAARFARGRAAIHLASLPGDWPALLHDTGEGAEERRARVRAIYLESGPDLTFANMAPRPMDLGPISDVANGTWRTFDRWPVLRGAFMATLFLSLLGTAFYLVRY